MIILRSITFSKLFAFISVTVLLFSCSKNDDFEIGGLDPVEAAPYAHGFFVITEGSYGQTSGTGQYYAYGADTIATRV